MARTFEPDSWVWLPDEEEMAVPAKVLATFRAGDPGRVRTEDGEDVDVQAEVSANLIEANTEVLNAKIDNLINLNDLNENAILHNLRIRFKRDIIYTNVSTICISVNPFKLLPLYTPEIMDKYREGAKDLPPHVFKIADFAYKGMLADRSDQSIIISGESGAGKSEATKLMLQYIAEISSRAAGSKKTASDHSLEQQILQANPVMEAFGNAKTVRNNNSSRFGKLITVKFESNGAICGGSIVNYLLEKSRVIFQAQGERNYHIFYQIIAGAKGDAAFQKELQTGDPQDFHYLDQSGVVVIEGHNDEKDFDALRRAFRTLGMDEDTEVKKVLKTVAALLHLGNVSFDVVKNATAEDSSAVSNMDTVELAAKMLGLEMAYLAKKLTSKNVGTRSEVIVPYDVQQATASRDAVVKTVYGNLFQFIINRINKALVEGATVQDHANIIGVLDIFGFESFATGNSFEQLCINYCNEKLQFHFNEHIFRLEQEVYDAEGVNVPKTDFKDNQPTIDLLEVKGSGIFPMIDEEINVPRGSDDTLLNKLRQAHRKHPNFSERPSPKLKVPNSSQCFAVVHYAGQVFYDVTNFLEKNKDQLHADLQTMLQTSSEPFTANLFAPNPAADEGSTPSKVRSRGPSKKSSKQTLGSQFKSSLASLMTTLNASEPHFVRCMKPNSKKAGSIFESEMMLAQLRYSGLLEVCRIRKLGYPVRRDDGEFFKRYEVLGDKPANVNELISQLVAKGVFQEGQFARGKTKVFMRNAQATQIEEVRDEAITKQAIRLQSVIRGVVWRFKVRNWIRAIRDLRTAIAERNEENLNNLLDYFHELPHGGKHLSVYKDARRLQMRLDEERQVVHLLEAAIEQHLKESLKSAIAASQSMSPPLNHPKVKEATELVARIEKEEHVIAGLKKAMASRSRADLERLLQEAAALAMDGDEVRQAQALKVRLEEEEAIVETLRVAIKERDGNKLSAVLAKASEMGIKSPAVDEAKKLFAQLQAEIQATKALTEAVESRDLDALQRAISRARAAGVQARAPELVASEKLVATLQEEGAALKALTQATASRDAGAIAAALGAAAKLGLTAAKNPQVADAEHCRDTLAAQDACRKTLSAAVQARDLDKLSAALSEAASLGLAGAEVDKGKALYDELSTAATGAGKLALASKSDSVDEVEAALSAGREAGLESSPEYKAAENRLAALKREEAAVAELEAATASSDAEHLAQAIAQLSNLGAANKYPAAFSAAKERLAALQEAIKISTALQAAVQKLDLGAFDASVARADELKVAQEPTVRAARDLRDKLLENKAIDDQIHECLATDNTAKLRELYSDAQARGIQSEAMRQAQVIVEREAMIIQTFADIVTATETHDLNLLQKSLETAIQLGLSDPRIDGANALREVLQEQEGEIAKVVAATSVLEKKMSSTAEIRAQDVDIMKAALDAALASGKIPEVLLPGADLARKELVTAEEMVQRGRRQLEVQEELRAAVDSKSHEKLKAALSNARELFLNLHLLDEARILFKELDQQFQAAREAEDVGAQDIDATEAAREDAERREKAKHPKFRFTVYPGLRSPDDFAKSVLLGKRKLKDSMLKWTASQIPKSLTEMSSAHSKIAVQLHKSLLGYMGDKQMSFPATLAQDILDKGLKTFELRDEVYLQIIKQLSSNPAGDSIAKGWQVMCMCVNTFPPSSEFEYYLLNFMLTQAEKRGAVRNYAKYCLRTLQGMLGAGASGFVPSVENIQAYKERPPILATVELVDGRLVSDDLPVTPDLNVGQVADLCSHFLGLTDARASAFGIFVYDLGCDPNVNDPDGEKTFADLERTPRPLRNEDFMGDIVVLKARQKRNFKFVFKRKIFLRSQNQPSDDPMFSRLVYLQAEDEVITQGNIDPTSADEAAEFAALSYRVVVDTDFPEDAKIIAYDEELPILDFVPPGWREQREPLEWANSVLNHRTALLAKSAEDCQDDFIAKAGESPLYGAHFFNAHVISCGMNRPRTSSPLQKLAFPRNSATWRLPDIKLAFNQHGMWLFTADHQVLKSFGYADVYRWGGSSSMFSLIIWNADDETTFELKLSTSQAPDMAGIILDYINSIMEAQQGRR